VDAAAWRDSVAAALDDGYRFLALYSAVDQDPNGLEVLLHLLDVEVRPLRGVALQVALPADAPSVPSLADLLPTAAWHERELHEMFGIAFPGHPGLEPLLLPPGFAGHPLRKSFPLAGRAAAWPGDADPSGRVRRSGPLGRPGAPR
jgi:NADH-quinone oxidoreductase subunit C